MTERLIGGIIILTIEQRGLLVNYRNRTWIETDLYKATANFLKIKEIAGGKRIFAVVKANAYGHGAVVISKLFEDLGTDGFAVSNIDEALEIRNAGIKSEILILGYTPFERAAELIKYNISQTVYSLEYAENLNSFAKKSGGNVKVHIKLDTGMGRLGFDCRKGFSDGVKGEIISCLALKSLNIEGLFTHFATADGNDSEYTEYCDKQYEIFKTAHGELVNAGFDFKYVHTDNSAATVTRKDDICNTVRPGIVLYGYLPDPELKAAVRLDPVMSVKSVVSMVKDIDEGDSVSYGRTFTASGKMKVATVPVGYADGYPRYLSNKGYVLIGGKRADILGRVCMDQIVVDVSDIKDVTIGDTVTLIGSDGDQKITAEDIAKIGGTISYEVVCGFAPRVEKYYI